MVSHPPASSQHPPNNRDADNRSPHYNVKQQVQNSNVKLCGCRDSPRKDFVRGWRRDQCQLHGSPKTVWKITTIYDKRRGFHRQLGAKCIWVLLHIPAKAIRPLEHQDTKDKL